jgi:hypothetical protein
MPINPSSNSEPIIIIHVNSEYVTIYNDRVPSFAGISMIKETGLFSGADDPHVVTFLDFHFSVAYRMK